jgi:phospholipid/cholesterol/gamma-HCH transport system permease protein
MSGGLLRDRIQAPHAGEVNTRADIARLASQVDEPPKGPLATLGAIAKINLSAVREFRHWPAFISEALRQAALIATGSVVVILAISFLAGGSCGLESSSLARAFGTRPIAAGFSSWCTLREVVPFVFGYILAAKVGCGIVAEIGAMRVNEEVDALEAMGVRSLAHLVSSRLLACMIVLPFTYLLAIGASYLAAYLMSAKRFGDVSGGTWSLFFYLFQDPTDLIYSAIKGLLISGFVIATAVFYGYTVRGGPTEVGVATARSMAVNIMAVTVISMAGTLVFWGANPRIPFG